MPTEPPRRRAAVLGSPIGHSLSPVLHRAAYAGLGLDWRYDAIDMDTHRLAPFLAALGPEWVGLSLTMPLKEVALGMVDTASELVGAIGAANTVVLSGGRRHAENTDVAGIVASLDRIGAPRGGSVLVIGSGGTARAAVAAAAMLGAPEVAVAARRPQAGADLVAVGATLDVRVRVVSWPETALPSRAETPVVISAVPAAATQSLLDLMPQEPGWLLDVSYDPWPARLAQRWTAAGGAAVGGAVMLAAQAAEQVRLMSGHAPDPLAMERELFAALATR